MPPLHLVRFQHPQQGVRIGVIDGETLVDVTRSYPTIGAFLRASSGRIEAALADLRGAMHASIDRYPASALDAAPEPDALRWLAPCDEQDVWASGVTYERSRAARQEEAVDGGDVYARVYAAERPELFFKARGERVVGHGDTVGIRTDATWNVPEPELALVITPALEVIGFTVGNDMSSRDIEGENPLYLPQAKVYKRRRRRSTNGRALWGRASSSTRRPNGRTPPFASPSAGEVRRHSAGKHTPPASSAA